MPGSVLRFDYKTLCLGRRLTDQQLWCMGCDVRERPDLLAGLGWMYHPRPDKTSGCGRLTGMLPDGGHLSVWGFGFLARDVPHGVLWLDRKGFRPCRAGDIDVALPIFGKTDLPVFRAPENADEADAALFLLGQLAERMADYEEDVLVLRGVEARRRSVFQWKFRCSALDVEEMPGLWRRVARGARDLRRAPDGVSGGRVRA